MSLLVSIHDVTPALEPGVRRLWDMCAARGIAPALLVVPDWHGRWPLQRSPAFVEWLHDAVARGAEIVLHGERHSPGEFRTLDGVEAGARIQRGVTELRRLGLAPTGFVPPAWLAREATHAAARELGLGFSEDAHAVRILASGRRLRSPAVRWSARTPLRAWGSVCVARGRWMLQRGARYPRLAFHPQDFDHPRTTRDLPVTLDRWLARHRPVPYAALIDAVPTLPA